MDISYISILTDKTDIAYNARTPQRLQRPAGGDEDSFQRRDFYAMMLVEMPTMLDQWLARQAGSEEGAEPAKSVEEDEPS